MIRMIKNKEILYNKKNRVIKVVECLLAVDKKGKKLLLTLKI